MTPPGGKLRALAPGLANAIIRALAIQGDYPAEIEPKYSMGIQVEDLTNPEYWFLRGGKRYASCRVAAAVAGQQSFIQLNGGITGDSVMIVERIAITNDAVANVPYTLGLGTAVAAGAQNNLMCQADDRHRQIGYATFISGASAAPVLPAPNPLYVRVPNSGFLVIEGPWIITGNLSLNVICNTVNTVCAVNFWWRERKLLKSELVPG